MEKADYIITGAGASGLLLAYRMAKDSYFKDTSIIIIDKTKAKGNDRTWCYWEEANGEWDAITHKTWTQIYFGSAKFSTKRSISPYIYKMIRSSAFYDLLWNTINKKSNIRFVHDTISHYESTSEGITLKGIHNTYQASKLFNSIANPKIYQTQDRYPVLQQHFLGWFIKTKTDAFDDSVATFMDFNIPQKGNTRFMYVLPTDKKTALFEYTLFSKDLLKLSEYEDAIKIYLEENGIKDYEIIEVEKGSIPMTSFKFLNLNSENILHIGTAGGWTKASTGYTFRNTTKQTKKLVAFLKTTKDLSKFSKRTKYWFYDLILLDVLAKRNDQGANLFASLFKKASTKTIFRFLDDESNLKQDLRIITAVPPKHFMASFVKRLFQGW